jgi:hypothetical protein
MAIAKWLVAFVAIYCYGGVLADAVIPGTSRMHLWNTKWPPHAKFHNAQTMLIGVFTGTLSLILLFSVRPLTMPWFLTATAVASIYWLGLIFAPLFPGTAWLDPEFETQVVRPLGLNPQQFVSYVLCMILIVAAALALWPNS